MAQALWYGGAALMAASAVAAAVFAVVFRIRKKRLNAQLDEEFGNVRR